MSPNAWFWCTIFAPIVGCILAAVLTRIKAPGSIILGRSCCDACSAALAACELVPLESWFASRSRCRRCAQPIGLAYPIELAAIAVVAGAITVFLDWALWVSCVLGLTLLALAIIDYKYYVLPDLLTLPLIPLGLIATWVKDPMAIIDHIIGVVAGFAFVVILRVVYRRLRGRDGIGMGDAKLLAAAGAFVSWQALPSVILIASLTALVLALARTFQGANLTLVDRLPFGTFLCLATWIVWFNGPLTGG